jgi:hypothetical protein
MKRIVISLFSFLLCFFLTSGLYSQDDGGYSDGSVYQISMTKTKANSQGAYLNLLNRWYVPMMQKAQEKGLIKSFKIMTGPSANTNDFDVMIMVEHENMASFDPNEERAEMWSEVRSEVREMAGGEEAINEILEAYEDIRRILGRKLMREQVPN